MVDAVTPEFEQLAQLVEHELTIERCRTYCDVCSGRRRARPGIRWSLLVAGWPPQQRWSSDGVGPDPIVVEVRA